MVHLGGRDRAKLERVARLAGKAARIVVADITTRAGIAALARRTRAGLDILVHSAGLYRQESIEAINAKAWAELDAVNLHAPVILTMACLAQLRAVSGQVVFINSTAGLHAGPRTLAYAAGKHGLRAAADALRQQVSPDGIRVLSVFPGRTDTPMQRAILKAEKRTAPPGTLLRAEDIADMVLAALKAPRSSEVTEIVMRPSKPLPAGR